MSAYSSLTARSFVTIFDTQYLRIDLQLFFNFSSKMAAIARRAICDHQEMGFLVSHGVGNNGMGSNLLHPDTEIKPSYLLDYMKLWEVILLLVEFGLLFNIVVFYGTAFVLQDFF